MIARIRPSYATGDLGAAWRAGEEAVGGFERELASYFGTRHALAFPYGRTAIHACLRALDRRGEVVQPAYNCVVVAHATVLAGCSPIFVDAQSESPNQDPAEMVDRVSERTVAVVPTSVFGIAFDAGALCEAIRRRNPRAVIVMDCCQCFDARWNGERMALQGDAAVLAFGIGKPMTTLFGGALLTDRDDLAAGVRRLRDATFRERGGMSLAARWLYFLASWLAFSEPASWLTDLLENGATPLQSYLKSLRAREAIRLPKDNETRMSAMEAAIGREQLGRVAGFIRRRRDIAHVYAAELGNVPGLRMLEWPEGSSYAIYAARVGNPRVRAEVLARMRKGGVQGDTTLAYVVPGLECYRERGYEDEPYPSAMAWSKDVINFPNHPTMTSRQVARVVRVVRRAFGEARVRAVVGPAPV